MVLLDPRGLTRIDRLHEIPLLKGALDAQSTAGEGYLITALGFVVRPLSSWYNDETGTELEFLPLEAWCRHPVSITYNIHFQAMVRNGVGDHVPVFTRVPEGSSPNIGISHKPFCCFFQVATIPVMYDGEQQHTNRFQGLFFDYRDLILEFLF
jgi:hypothetical protein